MQGEAQKRDHGGGRSLLDPAPHASGWNFRYGQVAKWQNFIYWLQSVAERKMARDRRATNDILQLRLQFCAL